MIDFDQSHIFNMTYQFLNLWNFIKVHFLFCAFTFVCICFNHSKWSLKRARLVKNTVLWNPWFRVIIVLFLSFFTFLGIFPQPAWHLSCTCNPAHCVWRRAAGHSPWQLIPNIWCKPARSAAIGSIMVSLRWTLLGSSWHQTAGDAPIVF